MIIVLVDDKTYRFDDELEAFKIFKKNNNAVYINPIHLIDSIINEPNEDFRAMKKGELIGIISSVEEFQYPKKQFKLSKWLEEKGL